MIPRMCGGPLAGGGCLRRLSRVIMCSSSAPVVRRTLRPPHAKGLTQQRAFAGLPAIASLAVLLCAGNVPAQDWAKAKLEKSPRHQEWVQIQHGDRVVHAFLVYPEKKEKASSVLVLHENQGLTDWVRHMADQLAQAGYIAIAPDLLSGSAPGGGKTSDFPSGDAAREAIYQLKPETVAADLNAVADYVKKLPAANGLFGMAGFCWGGTQTFRFATQRADLSAAFVFYGTAPDNVDGIRAPVFGFYGGEDARVTATVPATEKLMKVASKYFVPVTYKGAGHGFMRSGEAPEPSEANQSARNEAWKRLLGILEKL